MSYESVGAFPYRKGHFDGLKRRSQNPLLESVTTDREEVRDINDRIGKKSVREPLLVLVLCRPPRLPGLVQEFERCWLLDVWSLRGSSNGLREIYEEWVDHVMIREPITQHACIVKL